MSKVKIFLTEDLSREKFPANYSYIEERITTDTVDHIIFYIDSDGGDFWTALSYLDLIEALKKRNKVVSTINMGVAGSASALILMAGSKRYAFPSSKVVIHHPYSIEDPTPEGTKVLQENIVKQLELLEKYTNKNKDFWKTNLDKNELWIDSKTSQSLGIIDYCDVYL